MHCEEKSDSEIFKLKDIMPLILPLLGSLIYFLNDTSYARNTYLKWANPLVKYKCSKSRIKSPEQLSWRLFWFLHR